MLTKIYCYYTQIYVAILNGIAIFAPYDPRQNPVEDVWLRGKNFLRRMWSILESFEAAKSIFKFYLQHEVFDFAKIQKYSPCSVLS